MIKEKLSTSERNEELLVDLTFHNLPASLLEDFTLQVVRPYYAGSLTIAVKDLIEKAVADHEFVNNHIQT